MKNPFHKNIHAFLFLGRPAIFRDGGEVPGSSESHTETGFNIDGLVEEWTRDGVTLNEIEKSIDRGDLSMKDLEKVIHILEEQEGDLDERMFQLTDELKEYVFFHGEAAEGRELNEEAVVLGEFHSYVKAGKYEMALLGLWEISDKSKVAGDLSLIVRNQPEALVPHFEELCRDDKLFDSLLSAMQEKISLDRVLSKAFVNLQVEEPYDPTHWFETIGVAMKILVERKSFVWFDSAALSKQASEALATFIKREPPDAFFIRLYLYSASDNLIVLDVDLLKTVIEKALIARLQHGDFSASSWLDLKDGLDYARINLDMELLNKAVVRSKKNEYLRGVYDFDGLQSDCKAFQKAGFPLSEELLALSESTEKAAEYKAKQVEKIDSALAKKDYENVVRSLYLLSDNPVKFKSTVEVVLQNAPQFLVEKAGSISIYMREEEAWAFGVLKELATRVDVGKILAKLILKEESVYGINLSNYAAFKEAGAVFREAEVSAASDARLLAEYDVDDYRVVPDAVQELMSDAKTYGLSFDKDKVSYYANARLLEHLDYGEDDLKFYLLTLEYEVKEMEDAELKVDRENVDGKVNTVIKNYARKYADDLSSALYLDDLVRLAKAAGVKLDKEIFEVAR